MKRKALALTLIMALLFSVAAGTLSIANVESVDSGAGSYAGDWPMFRYDAANSGTPDNVAPIAHDLLWTTDVLMDEYAFSIVGSSPAIVGDVVYIGSDDGYMYALNASSGAQLWNSTTDGSSVSSPAVVDGVVYFRTWHGRDYALDAVTGEEIWNFSAGRSYSSPAVVNGIYYACAYGNVTALNALTGSVIWSYYFGGNADGSPIVVDGTVYIGDFGYVYALDAQTGALEWVSDLQFDSSTDSSPAVVNGVVYVASGSPLFYALDAETGEPIWNYTIGQSPHSTAVVSNGIVYVGSGHQGVFALNALTGAEIWNYPTSPGMGSSVAVAGGNVYLAGTDGAICALNAATGAKLWSYTMNNVGAASSPSIANGVLYIRNSNGYLCAFGKASQPSVSIFPAFGLEGSVTTVSGSGFTAYSTVTATFDGAPITLSSSSVDPLGHLSATVTIPSYTHGTYPITLTDTTGCSASANFIVVSASITS
jgi:outer membrane protein assembly factor BamB